MNSERVGWKRRDISRVKQRDNDVTKISGVVGGKSHYGSGDPQIPLKVVLEHRIFVGNISYKVTKADLMKFFSKYGDVVNVHIVKDHAKGWSKGYGFVTFSDADATKKALEAPEDELYLDHRALRISKAEESRKAGFGALMAVDRDHRQVQKQKNQHTVNCHKAENANHDNSSPEVKPKQSSKSPKTTRHKYSKKSSKCCLLSLLNNDVLMEIFSYLPVKDRIISERVCKHWRDTLQKLWLSTKHLSFDNSFSIFKSRQGLTDKVLESVVAKGSGELVSMDLSAVPHLLTEHALSVIGVYCPKVTTLDLSGVAVTMKSMQVLTDRCIQLKWLRLQKCHQVTEKCLWWILRKCAHLEHLDVAGNRSVTGQCFVIAPKTIKSVILSECRQLAAAGISKLAHHCPNLELLDITKCCNINDQAIQDVLQHCLKLKELHFPVQSTAVKSTGFAANSLKNLTILVTNGHLMFNDEALVNITKNCPLLKELQCATCYNISDVGVASLTSCIQLSYLDISYCNNVTDKGLMQVIAICQLQHLITRACQGITDVCVT
ncbi:putative RNA-binding protein EEED8.10 isoform X2 [Dysidea avara]|uniref:putative RNA-binding protein EEED8.10 isoform X2 n=1 Tax=Dysidea avara TaxID=196820 RepID=UPI00332862A6